MTLNLAAEREVHDRTCDWCPTESSPCGWSRTLTAAAAEKAHADALVVDNDERWREVVRRRDREYHALSDETARLRAQLEAEWVRADEDAVRLINGHTARTRLTALDAALRALHRPLRIYDECDHLHEDGDPGVIDTGEYLTCEAEYRYSICAACCTDNPKWQEMAERCIEHDHSDAICPTTAILDQHTGGIS